jgi:hypothetical protein
MKKSEGGDTNRRSLISYNQQSSAVINCQIFIIYMSLAPPRIVGPLQKQENEGNFCAHYKLQRKNGKKEHEE